MHKPSLSNRVGYERLPSGTDVYVLPTDVPDVVECLMAFPGGELRAGTHAAQAKIHAFLFPWGTSSRARSDVRARFDALGADVDVRVTGLYLEVRIRALRSVFSEVLPLVMELLEAPKHTAAEFREAVTTYDAGVREKDEDTTLRAWEALSHAYTKAGHPLYVPSSATVRKELRELMLRDARSFYRDTLSSVGSIIVVAGDVAVAPMLRQVRTAVDSIPRRAPTRAITVDLTATQAPQRDEYIVTMRDKMNVDTMVGLPVAITRDHEDYLPLLLGVHALGGSASARLFHELRDKRSLTYGAYSSLTGFDSSYLGMFVARAIFPHDVFAVGRTALADEVHRFGMQGITKRECDRRKTELVGRYVVSLASTAGSAETVFQNALRGWPLSFVDEYVDRVADIPHRMVNEAIQRHIGERSFVTAAAGAIDRDGKPV